MTPRRCENPVTLPFDAHSAFCKHYVYKYHITIGGDCPLVFSTNIPTIQPSLITDSKLFWKFIRDKKQSSKLPNKNTTKNNLNTIADNFKCYFGSIYIPCQGFS